MKVIIYTLLFSFVVSCAHRKENVPQLKPSEGACVAKDNNTHTKFCSGLERRNCGIHDVCIWR